MLQSIKPSAADIETAATISAAMLLAARQSSPDQEHIKIGVMILAILGLIRHIGRQFPKMDEAIIANLMIGRDAPSN